MSNQTFTSKKPPKNDALISASQNRAMFDTISKRYDLLNRIISFGCDMRWRKKTVETLNPQSQGMYLDVGCGTGDLSLILGNSIHSKSIFGCDPSLNMLRIARKKVAHSHRQESIHYQQGDALNLPYKSNCFHGVILGFCIRNITNRRQALGEFYRVLRPKSRCVILELQIPEREPFLLGYRIYASIMLPVIATFLSQRKAYKYLNKSIQAFPSRKSFCRLMQEEGFQHCNSKTLFPGTVTVFSGVKEEK